MDENQNYQKQITTKERAQRIWTEFGPLILGAIILLVIVGGGWYVWRSRTVTIAPTATPLPQSEVVENLPSSQINLAETPSPEPTIAPTPTPAVVVEAKAKTPSATVKKTKGGLPATGAPTNIAFISVALVIGGLFLRKTSKRV